MTKRLASSSEINSCPRRSRHTIDTVDCDVPDVAAPSNWVTRAATQAELFRGAHQQRVGCLRRSNRAHDAPRPASDPVSGHSLVPYLSTWTSKRRACVRGWSQDFCAPTDGSTHPTAKVLSTSPVLVRCCRHRTQLPAVPNSACSQLLARVV